MIEQIEGATVAYLDDDWDPTTPDKATLIKVRYLDGRIVFVRPDPRGGPILSAVQATVSPFGQRPQR